MPDHAELAHLPRQSADARGARAPQAPTQEGRCPGAAAQLAAVHRTLRHGPTLQLEAGGTAAGWAQPAGPSRAAGANRTGLPDRLKAGVEALSGVSMDGVKVHYNSARPAQLNALAYAQGSEIHLGPGQERHLPHEAWHLVQQAEGRVRPTMQMKDGVPVNDDNGLEREADAMGAKASAGPGPGWPAVQWRRTAGSSDCPVQRVYATVKEVEEKNRKHLPTASFADNDKLTIANWCLARNSNALRQHYANDYQHAIDVTANEKAYHYTFDWDLAMHIDFGGAAHGSVDTPHLQAIPALTDEQRTHADVTIAEDGANAQAHADGLTYNDRDNAVALAMDQAQTCMTAGTLDAVKDDFRPKLRGFAEAWADGEADVKSGAKEKREKKETDVEGIGDMFS
jgi:uncharacterized protein DUF4157